MSKKIGSSHRTTKVSVRRLMTLSALSGAAVLSGVTIASASTTHSATPKTDPLHGRGGLYGRAGLHGVRHGVRPAVDGKVTALGAGSFTVLDRSSKTYTVTVTGTTTYEEHNVSSVGIGDVKVGSFVDVLGSVTGTNVTATGVRIGSQERSVWPARPMGVRPDAAGRITALGTNSFTIQDRSGSSLTVDVSASTTYAERGVTSGSFADIKVGDVAAVTGSVIGTNVTATGVRIGSQERSDWPARPMGVRPDAAGRITALGTNSFTIQDRSGSSLTVDVSASTTYAERGVTSGSFADIKVGDVAAVTGSVTGTTVAATAVHFGLPRPLDGAAGAPDFGHMPPMSGGPMGSSGM